MRRARRQVEQAPGRQRARREVDRARTLDGQILGSAAGDGTPERHGPLSLQLQPERVHVTVVMEPEPFAAGPVHQEQERALVASRAEERHAQRHHEPRHARQYLVGLGKEDRLARGEGRMELRAAAGSVIAAIRRDLEGEAEGGQRDDLVEARRHGRQARSRAAKSAGDRR
jgi:hypothetical protein